MDVFTSDTADAAWREAARAVKTKGTRQSGDTQPTRELLHACFTLSDPRQRIVFARPFNPALAVAETIWMLSGSNAADFVIFWNPRQRRFIDQRDPTAFHGAYGHRLGSSPRLGDLSRTALRSPSDSQSGRLDQVVAAYRALDASPDTRQVVLQIWDAARDLPDPSRRSLDVPCNLMSHLMVRSGRLEWLQVMRSNDRFWGTPVNFVQFTSLQEILAGWLGIELGSYVHISDSLHVYEHHWNDLDQSDWYGEEHLPANQVDLRIGGYEEWSDTFALVADTAIALTRAESVLEVERLIAGAEAVLPVAYFQWISLLAADALNKRGHSDAALATLPAAGPYWSLSWRRWFESKTASKKG